MGSSETPGRYDSGPSATGDDGVTRREGDSGHDTVDRRAIEAKVRSRIFAPEAMVLRIGRFTVLDELGKGGMGMVYAAYDEELDRKVAIKVLRDEELPSQDSRLRFQREAQTQARLSHPHVVTIHEVGEADDGQMFLAMEFVRGESFDIWLRGTRTWTEILEAYLQAGRGLLAAHDAGLVHRDFKPQNVMRSDDGVVKVLDFGLARALDEEPPPSSLDEPALDRTDASGRVRSGSFLTVPGEVMGTPSYMSPEQHDGSLADARSDQYGFCVAVWLALTGEQPFKGKDIGELFQAKLQGAPRWPSEAPPIPRRVVEALRRGLAVEPDQRWPSMRPLLETLTWDPARRRQRWLLGLAGVTVLATGGLVTRALSADSARCSGAQQQLAGIWDDARRAEVQAVITAPGSAYVTGVWENTARGLDAYANDWAAAHTEACEATTVRGEQSPQMLDRRMACLNRAAADLRATVDTLADADVDVVSNAHELVAGLRPLSPCSDPEALAAEVEPPLPEDAQAVEDIRRSLAREVVLRKAGRYDEAQIELDHAKQRLTTVDYRPVQAEVTLAEGRLLDAKGDYEAAEPVLLDALELASELRLVDAMRDATRSLMNLLGPALRRTDEALALRRVLLGLSRGRVQDDAGAHAVIAAILRTRGDYDEAEAAYRLAEELYAQAYGAEHYAIARIRGNLASVLQAKGQDADAEVELRAAIAAVEQSLGPEHPTAAKFRGDLGVALGKQEKYEEAEAEIRAALVIRIEAFGPDHHLVAGMRQNLAVVLQRQIKYEEAESEYRAIIAATKDTTEANEIVTAYARTNLGGLLLRQERGEEALVELRTAIAVFEDKQGPRHPNVLAARINLSSALAHLEREDEAEAESQALLPLLVEVMGPKHRNTTAVRSNLAVLLITKGKFAEAVPLLEEVLALRLEDGSTLDLKVESTHSLAKALWNAEGPMRDRARARTLEQEAYRLVREAKDAPQPLRDRLNDWLDGRALESRAAQ